MFSRNQTFRGFSRVSRAENIIWVLQRCKYGRGGFDRETREMTRKRQIGSPV
jgi:hypothetical protein